MEPDHKYSGTLPLLAYAPQDFGRHAMQARAYRARAAMGRTGVQPLQHHSQPHANPVHSAVTQLPPRSQPTTVPVAGLWRRLMQLLAALWPKQPQPAQNSAAARISTSEQTAVAPVNRRTPDTAPLPPRKADALALNRRDIETAPLHRRGPAGDTGVADHADSADERAERVPERRAEEVRHHVSSAYAAMRLKNAPLPADDQSIPQAQNLADALAGIRQALREHEKLADARLQSHSTKF